MLLETDLEGDRDRPPGPANYRLPPLAGPGGKSPRMASLQSPDWAGRPRREAARMGRGEQRGKARKVWHTKGRKGERVWGGLWWVLRWEPGLKLADPE